jgi:hypothetical protein
LIMVCLKMPMHFQWLFIKERTRMEVSNIAFNKCHPSHHCIRYSVGSQDHSPILKTEIATPDNTPLFSFIFYQRLSLISRFHPLSFAFSVKIHLAHKLSRVQLIELLISSIAAASLIRNHSFPTKMRPLRP